MEAVYGLGGDLHRRLEPEGHLRPADVVVDGLRHADHRESLGVETVGAGQGALASDHDEPTQAMPFNGRPRPFDPVLETERLEAGTAEHRSAAWQQAPAGLHVERRRVVLDYTEPAVSEADHLVAEPTLGTTHNSTDHCVQPRAVAPTGQNPDSHPVTPRVIPRPT